jgi:hypothetical protein
MECGSSLPLSNCDTFSQGSLLPFDLLQRAVQPSSNRNSIAPTLLRQQAGVMQFRTKAVAGYRTPKTKPDTTRTRIAAT